jgi:hypothetical protein
MAAMPTDTDALTQLPLGNAVAQFVDDARDFMSRNPRILNAGPRAFDRKHVTVTNPTSLHPDPDLSRARLGDLALHDLETRAGLGNLRDLHLRSLHWYNRGSARGHKSSSGFSNYFSSMPSGYEGLHFHFYSTRDQGRPESWKVNRGE